MNALVTMRVVVVTLALSACRESASPSPDAGGEREDDDASTQAPTDPEPVWRSSSQRLELSSFGFWEGFQGYDIARDQLSAEQREILEGLRVIPTPSGPVGADFTSYTLRITDRSGEVRAYRAAQDNVLDVDEGRLDGKHTLDYDTLVPFLETFDCMSAKEGGPFDHDAGTADKWNGAATFNTDPGCIHGVFIGLETSHSYRKWQIDEPGTYHLSIIDCLQEIRIRLFDPSGRREFGNTAFTTAPECPTLVFKFSQSAEYRIDVEKRKSPTTDHDSAGDVKMRVSRE